MTPETGTIRVLVVDDSEFFAEMTAKTLTREYDIDARYETSGEEALEEFETEQVDCIISDYEMPGMDGIEFLQAIQDRHGDVPFILLTGRGDEEVASKAIASGVSDYLLKLEVVEDEQYERLAKRVRNVVISHQTNKKHELLVDNSPDTIAHVTPDGRILAANPAMADRLGVSRTELVDASLPDVYPDPVGKDRLDAGRSAIDDGETKRTEDEYDARHFHNIFVPVDIASTEESFQMISRDITERKEREQALELQNDRLDRFASVVSHDLRNPLNVAQSSVELLEEDSDHVERIDRSLGRMEAIIENVLELARQGETVDDPSPVDLETMVEDAWSYIHTEAATLDIEESDEYILADAGRVTELLDNLFCNAVEHATTDDGGTVKITVEPLEDGFAVEDDGPGIPEDERKDVFETGYSTTSQGTGLGLSIVREITRAHGWDISITEGESGGARFEITDVEFR